MTVRIENNKILNNTMTSTAAGTQNNCLGGGLIIQYGNFVVTKNLISGNTASSLSTGDINVGGGMHAYGCSVQFRENIVTGNQVQGPSNISSYAGGVSFWAAEVQRQTLVVNNIISSNKAIGGNLGGGGGIMAFDEAARIENNIIVKNTAYLAGGVGCARVYLAASEKPADDGGGAVFGRISEQGHHSSLYTPSMVVAPPTLINNTIAYNKATSGSGGGIATRGSWIPKVINSIVWGDTASNEIYIQSGSIRVLYSNVTNGWPSDSGNISVNPQFADGTYRLANTSGCLQKGIDSVQIDGAWYHAPPFCTYGMPRPSPAGTRPDIGACENPTLVDGVDEPVNGLPKTFALEQNYPNPFNPTTTIKYQIPNSNRQMGFGVSYLGFVSLKVFDILGREVATLVNEVQGAGFKSVQWDASGVASGVYLYRLQAGGFVETKKCLVLR
ncbi:MAG: T9SS type A sorting domain-containing protein [Ignavibacteriae bacterium]|nr:T9SS type A sorting domain-containing protein [Ignavibacteriota bacterium]